MTIDAVQASKHAKNNSTEQGNFFMGPTMVGGIAVACGIINPVSALGYLAATVSGVAGSSFAYVLGEMAYDRYNKWCHRAAAPLLINKKTSQYEPKQIDLSIVSKFLSLVDIKQDFSDKTIRPMLNEIANVKPGIDLLTRIANIGRQFKIIASSTTATFPNLNLVQIEPTLPYFYVTEQNGEKFLVKGRESIRLAHELIHLMHAYENAEADNRRVNASIFDGMGNEEERLTISGSNHLETDNCCENNFLSAFNLPPRINHDGPTRTPPTPIDVIKVGALGTLKELLKEDSTKINFVGLCVEAKATTSLLSAAAYHNQTSIIDYLFTNHANLDQEDEIGGPILAALKHDHKELALSLIQRGVNRTLKDREQKTALDHLNQCPTSRYDRRSKPLFALLSPEVSQ